MSNVEVIPFREFMRKEWTPRSKVEIVIDHVNRHKVIYRVAGLTLSICLLGADLSFAADPGSIDAQADQLYKRLLNVGKWVIIVKGGIDTVNKAVEGDFISARKSFFGYLVVYAILSGLPWSFAQVDELFGSMR